MFKDEFQSKLAIPKSEIKSEKYPELAFIDRILTFLTCMYHKNADYRQKPWELFVHFMNSVNAEKLLVTINHPTFYHIIVYYYASRFMITGFTHLCTELYSLPISILKNSQRDFRLQPTYYLFFDPAHIAQLVVSSYKLFHIHDGINIEVKQTLNDNSNADVDVDVEYEFLLSRYEADPYKNALARFNSNCSSSEPDIAIPRKYTLEAEQQEAEKVEACPGYKVNTFDMSTSVPHFVLDSCARPLAKASLFGHILTAIENNPDTFLLLTIIVQVLESYQFIDSDPEDKSVDILIRKPARSFAKTRLGRTPC